MRKWYVVLYAQMIKGKYATYPGGGTFRFISGDTDQEVVLSDGASILSIDWSFQALNLETYNVYFYKLAYIDGTQTEIDHINYTHSAANADVVKTMSLNVELDYMNYGYYLSMTSTDMNSDMHGVRIKYQ